ncbi:hypothetical protein P4637_20700 [Halalkalibacterium halodurans]|uniref:hypothetical protein n=1 Tax=Halalkalibacterium halodurans TaxID=86665 RepID=UPI002E234FE6|nr:hypothetical protein [Halalkalibacterium halodurans]MED4087233.1 hypothetical protein [Halalkalibacterium halodurans]MED4106943.1 hypothetical protein [Halalkalibacterium halodurans]MED4111019.1 hypothetical protein [Halalkalibacterium halodurans]MED4125638.1 hypothetical protein [Halalkalibacterium halodurans]
MVYVKPPREERESYRSLVAGYLFAGMLVYFYSIPNIFFVYIDDMWRLFAILLLGSYLVVAIIASYVQYRLSKYKPIGPHFPDFIISLWSMAAINLYGFQALAEQPFFQEAYVNLLWIQVFLILFAWIKWISVTTRKQVAKGVTITLVTFSLFHLISCISAYEGADIYAFLFEEATHTPVWPGIALFFSGLMTRFMMATSIDLVITPEERALLIAEEKAREEALKRKPSEEMLSSGRYLEYGELDYEGEEGLTNYREKGSTTFEDVEFLYRENDFRYFSRMDLNPAKELMLYQENGQWYCQTAGQEPEKVLLSEWANDNEKEWRRFEINKREYLEQAIEYRRLVPRFVEIPSDIDASKIDWYD